MIYDTTIIYDTEIFLSADYLEDLKEFEQKLDQLKDMIYLDKEIIEYLHV